MFIAPEMLYAAGDEIAPGCRWQAMAGAGVASCHLREALFQNPAGLVSAPQWQLGSTTSRPFSLAELAAGGIGCSHTWKRTAIGLALNYQGSHLYNETTLALAAAYGFTRELAFGLTLRRVAVAIERYGSAGALLCDFGGQLQCSRLLRAGFILRNLFTGEIGRCHEKLPHALQSGFEWSLSPATSLCIDLYKEQRFPLELRCGAEQRLGDVFTLRAGWTSASLRLAAGFALHLKGLSLEYSVMTHPWLGLSHQFALYYFVTRREAVPSRRDGGDRD